MSIAALEVSLDGDDLAGACGAEQLRKIPSVPSYAPATAHFHGVDNGALSSPADRAFYYHLIRLIKPKFGLEIGTFKAGTTEVLASAMQANGFGVLFTIDPFGGDRVPPIIENWPTELREYVSFSAVNSMDFFIALEQKPVELDFVFIDGNHAYEYVSFDLNNSVRRIAPGGVIVLDDYDQPGVHQAAKDFLAANPGWEEIGGALDAFDPNDPFASMLPSIPEAGFLVLAAPSHFIVTDRPKSVEASWFAQPAMRGFVVDLAPGSPAGTLHARAFWRSFHDSGQEQLQQTVCVALPEGPQRIAIDLPERLVTTFDPAISRRSAEIALYWRPDVPGEPLRLLGPPEPLVE